MADTLVERKAPVSEKGASVSGLQESFGTVIAFVLPGFIGLRTLAVFDRTTQVWLSSTADKGPETVGGFMFVVLGSLGLGLFISGVRSCTEELLGLPGDLLLRSWRRWKEKHTQRAAAADQKPEGVKTTADESAAVRDEKQRRELEATYRDLREQHYRYYQFHGNTAVALLFVFFVALGQRVDLLTNKVMLCGLFAEVVLVWNAVGELGAYRRRVKDLLKPEKSEFST